MNESLHLYCCVREREKERKRANDCDYFVWLRSVSTSRAAKCYCNIREINNSLSRERNGQISLYETTNAIQSQQTIIIIIKSMILARFYGVFFVVVAAVVRFGYCCCGAGAFSLFHFFHTQIGFLFSLSLLSVRLLHLVVSVVSDTSA